MSDDVAKCVSSSDASTPMGRIPRSTSWEEVDSCKSISYSDSDKSVSYSLLRRSRGASCDAHVERVSFCTRRSFVPERVDAEIKKRYEFARKIGVGGGGKVYIAKDYKFQDRLVAVKKIRKPIGSKAEFFRNEVDIMKALDHPNICRLYETYVDSAYVYLVMEFLEGGDLFDRFVERRDVITEQFVADIIRQVTGAMHYAHSRGFAHRDIKPENICFCCKDTSSNQLKVIDWGYGKYFGHGDMESNVGTAAYVAPEVMAHTGKGRGYTSACDLWSLGVLAYVSLSGKPPFWGNFQEQLTRMKHEQFPLDGGCWDSVSSDARDFIRRCLRYCPHARSSTDCLLQHPWLAAHKNDVPKPLLVSTFMNMERFSHMPDFLSLCAASVARQVDHSNLTEIREVFSLIDSDGDGTLDRQEIEAGFKLALGHVPDDIDQIFTHLDLDRSGRITFTEYCAAALGERGFEQESVLWAAFKSFDDANDGLITLSDLKATLTRADVNQVWSAEVCQNVAIEVMEEYGDWDHNINFPDWLHLMRECSRRCSETNKQNRPVLLGNECISSDSHEAEQHRRSASGNCLPGVGYSKPLRTKLYRS